MPNKSKTINIKFYVTCKVTIIKIMGHSGIMQLLLFSACQNVIYIVTALLSKWRETLIFSVDF